MALKSKKLKIKKSLVEKVFNKKIMSNLSVLGLDTAFRRSGWCRIETNKEYIYLDFGFIDIQGDRYFTYDNFLDCFKNIINDKDIVIVEDTFYRFNVRSFKVISRIGAIAYTLARLKGCKVFYKMATSARKELGLKNAKKQEVHKQFLSLLPIDIRDEDIVDAIILAMSGILTERTLI